MSISTLLFLLSISTMGSLAESGVLPAAAPEERDASELVEADTATWVVLNHGRPAGEMRVARDGESVTVRYAHVDRNRGRWLENRYRISPDGIVQMAEARGMSRDGVVEEEPGDRFDVVDGEARWTRRGGGGGGGGGEGDDEEEVEHRAPMGDGAFYRLSGSTAFDDLLLARFLLSRPERSGALLPEGRARLEIAAETSVATPNGPERVRYAVIHDGGGVPRGLWLDQDDDLVASSIAWFITVRPDMVEALDQLRAIELAWRDRAAETSAAPLLEAATPAGALVIRNGDVFDSERGVLLPRHTVVVEGDRITAVGPAAAIASPPGATVIDATGRTVMPGLWDMHVHLQATTQSSGALTMLAAGLTSVRDLAADLDVAVSYRDRIDAGRIVGPRVVLAGFIEGPGEWAGPSEAVASTEEEALAWIERYHRLGYRQIKLYNLVQPDLVPAIAEETHRRGMRLSGHVPRGLSVLAAVRLGFDEINHAAFLFSTFFQDSLYVPEMRPYSGVAAVVSPEFDVEGPEVTEMIELLRESGTVIDGTFAIWAGAGTLRGEGNPGGENYLRMLKRLYDAGVTIVAGTDNTRGSTFITELELHEHAGIPSAEVLRIATLGAARVMGEEADYGSLEAGKVADILIVNGRPTEGVEALRELDHVIRAGRVFTPDALREAARGR